MPRLTRAADPLRVGVGSDRSVLVAWVGCSGVAPTVAVDDGSELAGEAADAARYEVDLRKSDGEFVRSASAPPAPPAANEPPPRVEAGRAVLLLSGLAPPVVVVPAESTGLPTGENADPDNESRLRCRELPVDDDETAPDRLLDGGVEAV